MNNLSTRAELVKLARLLETDEESVRFLAHLQSTQLRALREGITDALFEKFRASFHGFARLASLLPLAISAKIAKHVLGAMLSGRVAGELPPERAIALSARLPVIFLADTCLELDPQRAKPIIAGFPIDRAIAITRILLARGEYITMARFVDVLPDSTLLACTDAIAEEAELLRISFFVEEPAQLDAVITHLNTARRLAVIRVASEQDLWPEVIATLGGIGEASQLALARLALDQDAAILNSLLIAAADNDLWPNLLALGRRLPDSAIADLAHQRAFGDAGVVRSIIDSVVANDLWHDLQALLVAIGTARCARMLEVAAADRPAFLAGLGQRVGRGEPAAAALQDASRQLAPETRARALTAIGDNELAARLAEPI